MDNTSKLRKAVRQAYYAYLNLEPRQRSDYNVPAKMLNGNVVPYTYFAHRLLKLAPFNQDARGARAALGATLDELVLTGFLERVTARESSTRYDSKVAVYRKGLLAMLGESK